MDMSLKRRADKIRKILRTVYPDVKKQLIFENPFQLLVATILSAQCTDKQVNQVTPVLFAALPAPENFATADIEIISRLIRPTGYYHNKAKNIKACSQMLIEKFGGEVPDTLEALVQLPGVGRKTANVVLGAVFGKPGVVVDTHVARISGRLGFTTSDNPVRIERDLMEILPRKSWNSFCLRLIYFGRQTCRARNPSCPVCPVRELCPFQKESVVKQSLHDRP